MMEKKNRLSYIIALLSIIVLFNLHSCLSREDKAIYQRTYWPNGKIYEEYYLIDDTLLHGVKKVFYKNGKLKSLENYSLGLLNGLFVRYYENDQIECKLRFLNGLKNGNCFWFYPNGSLNKQSYWINGKQFGNSFFYHENGRIRTFVTNTFHGEPQYLVKYDSLGNIEKEEGAVLDQFLIDQKFDSIPINFSVNMFLSVSMPPERKVIVEVGKYYNSELVKIDSCNLYNNIASFKYAFKNVGEDSLFFIGKMRNSKDVLIKSDTIVVLFNVIAKLP